MQKINTLLFCSFWLLSSQLLWAEKKVKQPKRPVLGWSEKITLLPAELSLHARMDTSRAGSTLNVSNIKKFSKSKNSYVKFSVKDRYGKEDHLERKVLRTATITTQSGNKFSEYVVELGFCLAGKYFEDEIALSERVSSQYDVRLGRQSLEGHFTVDPALTYTTKPDCDPQQSK